MYVTIQDKRASRVIFPDERWGMCIRGSIDRSVGQSILPLLGRHGFSELVVRD